MERVLDGDECTDWHCGLLVSVLFLTQHPHHHYQSHSHLVTDIPLDVGKYHS